MLGAPNRYLTGALVPEDEQGRSPIARASAAGRKVPDVTLAFRTPGLKGQLTTEAVDTFGAATVTAVREHLSPMPVAGSISLTLPAQSHVLAAPAALQRAGPFGTPSTAAATEAFVTLGAGGSSASYAVSAV